jgi:AcrR family transcriptional regulator
MKTKDKVIQGSIELFNLNGERNVTTNHIAAHIGISPGNLYYHYRNKDDIIRSIYKLYEKNLDQMFQPQNEESAGMDEMMYYLDRVFYSMWQFRFFYANLPDILARDSELHERYLVAQKSLYQRMIATLSEVRSQGYITLDDEMMDDLAHTLKLVVTFWISYQHTQSSTQITQATISKGVLKILNIVKGYLTPSGLVHINEIEKNYLQMTQTNELA